MMEPRCPLRGCTEELPGLASRAGSADVQASPGFAKVPERLALTFNFWSNHEIGLGIVFLKKNYTVFLNDVLT